MKDCNQCGKCCIKYGDGALSATKEEIDLWEIFEPNIFKYVRDNEIWIDPESGLKLRTCPFLEVVPQNDMTRKTKYSCSIYLNRPEDCRHYPSLVSEMIRDECEMIEAIDLDNWKKAQRTLDKKMTESRPARVQSANAGRQDI